MSAEPGGVEGIGSVPHAYYERTSPLTGVVLLPGQERHDTGEHPENVRRLPPVVERLQAAPEWEDIFVMHPRPARVEQLALAHDERYVESVRAAAAEAPLWLDTDTRVAPGSFDLASFTVGAALTAVDAVAMEAYWRPDSVFAVIRPPGHHSGIAQAMGFCLFNNVAIAARYAAATYGFDRIAVVDWDVHHGNGTQEIHWRDSSVLFISLHQWPLYPGTGWLDEVGEGEGTGFNVNLPMPAGSGDREYLEAFEAVVEPIVEAYAPQLLLVSAGQDCHAADPLGNQMVSAAGFNAMAARMAAQARRLGIGLVVCHEGGYNVSTLPQLDHAILAGLGGFDADLEDVFAVAAPPAPGWPERLDEIRRSLGTYWSGIGGGGR